MKIAIGSDHAGFELKGAIIELLEKLGHAVDDFGTHSSEPVDYPLFIRPTAEAVAAGRADRGIVLGGSGNGEAMVANRVRGVRLRRVGASNRRAWAARTTMPTCSRSVLGSCPASWR